MNIIQRIITKNKSILSTKNEIKRIKLEIEELQNKLQNLNTSPIIYSPDEYYVVYNSINDELTNMLKQKQLLEQELEIQSKNNVFKPNNTYSSTK